MIKSGRAKPSGLFSFTWSSRDNRADGGDADVHACRSGRPAKNLAAPESFDAIGDAAARSGSGIVCSLYSSCCGAYVAYWHKADIAADEINVRFRGQSGH
jgi:hypothetical protein